MPAEQVVWEGAPSIKTLALDFVVAVVFTTAVAAGVTLAYRPALRLAAGISSSVAGAIAANEPGLRLAAIVFVVVVGGGRLARVAWRAIGLRACHYRLSNQRLLIESGVLSKTIVEIDLRTVDEIVFHQSFGERLLGVGQIAIASSEPDPGDGPRRFGGGARLGARLVGVRDPRAVRELIRNAAYDATGSQVFMRST